MGMGAMWMKSMLLVLLLCMLMVTPMTGARSDNSGPWMWCDPEMGHKVSPLTRCRALVKLECVGNRVPEDVLRDCCQEVANISNEWCRCGDLGSMLRSVYAALGVGGGPEEVFPGCQKDVMKLLVAGVPALCNVPIPNEAAGTRGVCYWSASTDT
ncbi:alpha-amylase inhibitor BDAI-1 [Hordeum vulgare subsp. vulgare]|nr:alpha-amylase inhibitor BDAI-1 [Hordeum vulgare subsp. vulgare]BAK07003.1 predicted protein [Hordeum vulgare subsp. vulgare]